MAVKNNKFNEDLDLYDSDLEFINQVLDDEDIYWEYPLYKETDGLMLWIIQERLERSLSLDILGEIEDENLSDTVSD